MSSERPPDRRLRAAYAGGAALFVIAGCGSSAASLSTPQKANEYTLPASATVPVITEYPRPQGEASRVESRAPTDADLLACIKQRWYGRDTSIENGSASYEVTPAGTLVCADYSPDRRAVPYEDDEDLRSGALSWLEKRLSAFVGSMADEDVAALREGISKLAATRGQFYVREDKKGATVCLPSDALAEMLGPGLRERRLVAGDQLTRCDPPLSGVASTPARR